MPSCLRAAPGALAMLAPLVLSLALSGRPATADTVFVLQSWSDSRSYGLLVQAPEGQTACRAVRYALWQGNRLVGRTPSLRPGDVAILRMGRGFAPGDHLFGIRAQGCAAAPAGARRISLAKGWADHGWRAALTMAEAGQDR